MRNYPIGVDNLRVQKTFIVNTLYANIIDIGGGDSRFTEAW